MKTSKTNKKTSALLKITVTILITAFLLTATGTVITLFTPGYFDYSFSSFSSGADIIRKALYFVLCAVLFVALVSALIGGKRGYAAFVLCCIATINIIDLFCARSVIFMLSGATFSTLSMRLCVQLLVRFHITVMISASAALMLRRFDEITVKTGFVIAVLTSLAMLPHLLYWVEYLQSAAADILRGDFTYSVFLLLGNMTAEFGAALTVAGVSLLSINTAVSAVKKR